jgi:hypothetical protein
MPWTGREGVSGTGVIRERSARGSGASEKTAKGAVVIDGGGEPE